MRRSVSDQATPDLGCLHGDWMIETFLLRNSRMFALRVTLAGLAVCVPAVQAMDSKSEIFGRASPEVVKAPPVKGSAEWADLTAAQFGETVGWETEFVKDGKGDPEAVRLFLPSPLKPGDAGSERVETVLPLEPPGHVIRFKQIPFNDGMEDKVAFRFADIGWNVGSEGSNVQPQIDILFHIGSPEELGSAEDCAPERTDCKPLPTEGELAKRLADRPPTCFLPSGSVPVAERATAETGLFNLAVGPDSGPDEPVVIYGTDDGEIVFLGVSITLQTLRLAVDEGSLGDRLSWPISQPMRYRHRWWPDTIALEFRDDQNRFALSLEDFSERTVQITCR